MSSAFRDQVAAETQGRASDEFAFAIRQPDMVRRWRDALVELKVDVDQHLSYRKANLEILHHDCMDEGLAGKQRYFAERAEYLKWKRAATRFKQGLEQRLRETNKLLRDAATTQSGLGHLRRELLREASKLIPASNEEWHRLYAAIAGDDRA